MKKLSAIIISITLVFTLCSCQPAGDDISDTSSYSEPTYNSQIDNTISELVEPDTSSETPSADTSSEVVVSKPEDTESSNTVIDNSSKEEVKNVSSKEEISEEEPKESINFVPNTTVSYSNKIFYKDAVYACARGKNNGVDCWAVVALDDNGEYLNCVYVFDEKNDEHATFNVYNDRIYFLQFVQNDPRDYVLLDTFSLCSVNLSGKDKKTEKTESLSYTHISLTMCYSNSRYLFLAVTNLYDGVYDAMYRYNLQTKELVKLNYNLPAHTSVYSVGERIFIWNSDNQSIFEYDVNITNYTLFHTVDDPHRVYSLVVSLQKDGFLLHHSKRDDKYFLDFSGNLTQISWKHLI